MSFSGGEMVVGVRLDDQLTPGLKTAANALIAFTTNAERSIFALSRLGAAAAPIAGLGVVLGTGVKAAGDLQQQVANLNAVLAATPNQMAAITAKSLDLSRQTQFTTSQILQAQVQLAKAGANPGALISTSKNVLDLASATFSTPKDAATAYVAAQKDFQLSTLQSKDTVDILAKAVDSSTGNLQDFQTAFKQIGPVAHANGLSLRDTTTAIADLMQAGLKGDAGTALKTFLQRIVTETPQARKEIQALGLEFFNANGTLKSTADIFDEIKLKTGGLSDEQAQQALGTIFGTRGIRVADIARDEGSTGLSDTALHMSEIGTAAEIQAKKLATFEGQAHKLASSLNILAVQGGNAVLPMLTDMEQALTGVANKLTNINQVGGGILPQLLIGGGALYGANKLSQGIADRRAAPGLAQAAQDQAIADSYMAREQSRYQSELGSYEAYQGRVAEFQAQEEVRLATHNTKLEMMQAEHQAKLDAIQKENISTPIAGRAATAEQEAAFAKQVEQNTFVAGKGPSAVSRPVPIALPLDIEPDIDARTLGQKIQDKLGSAVANAGTGLQSFMAKSLLEKFSIALLVKDLIVDPLNNAVVQAQANSATPQTFDKQLGFLGDTQQGQAANVYASDLAALDQYSIAKKAKLKEIQDYQNSWQGDLSGARIGTSESTKERQNVEQDIANSDAARQKILAMQKTSPDQAYNEQVQRLQDLAAQAGQGKLSTDQAMAAFANIVTDGGTRDAQVDSLTHHLEQMGVPMEKINDLIASAKPLLDQQIQQYYDSADATDAANKKSQERADLLRSLGVSDQDIRLDAAGGKANLPIHQQNNQIIKDDQKDATELKKSLDLAASGYDTLVKSVGKLAPDKGIPDLLKNLDALKAAQADLTVNGQSNGSLNDLVAIGSAFQQLTDEEHKARAGYDAFLLGIAQTQSYNKEIDAFKQELTSLDQYLANKPASAKTADDTKYLENKKVLLAELNNQQDKLYESEIQQVNALAASGTLPDFAEMNAKWQATLAMFGGGPAVQLKLEMDATDALRSSKNVQTVMDAVAKDPHHIRLLLDNYPEVQADLDKAGGDISKLSAKDWQILLDILLGDKSGADALDALGRAQGAHYQAEVNIVYKQTNPELNPATTSDYHDVAHHVNSLASGAIDQQQQATVGITANTSEFDAKMRDVVDKGYAAEVNVTANVSAAQAAIDSLKNQTINVGINYGADAPATQQSYYGPNSGNNGSGAPAGPKAAGGAVHHGRAIVGDSRTGRPTGFEEVVEGDFHVYSHEDAMRKGWLGGDGMPHYAGGTDVVAIGGTDGPYDADFPGPVGDLSKKITHSGGGVARARKGVQGIKQDLLDATTALNDFSGALDGLSAKEVESVTQNFDKLYATLKSFNEGQLPKGATQGQKDAADSSALNQSLTNATAWAQAMYDIDHNAQNVKADIQAIADTGGPIGQNMAAQVTLMGQMAQVSQQIKSDQEALKTLNADHAKTLRDRRNADQETQRDRRTLSVQEQQASVNEQRTQTLADWRLQDKRLGQERDHQKTLDNIQSASDAENDAWTITQHNEQDAMRALQQRGTVQQRQLEDQQTAVERAHRDALGRNNANEQLLAAQSMAARSSGSSDLSGIQLAIAKYNDKVSLTDYQKQLDSVQDAIKDQARLASDTKFDLETEQIAAQRAHEKTMLQLSEASKAENQHWQGVQLTYQDQDKAITRTRTLEQWAEADRQRNEQLTYAAIDEYIAGQRQKEDDAYTDKQQKLQDNISANQEILKGLGNDLTALRDIETTWEKLYPIVGDAANVLLNFGQSIIATAGQNVTASGGYSRRLGNALGTDYFVGGATSLGEHGIEAVLAPGSRVLSNASIHALVNALATPLPSVGGNGGHTFNFNLPAGSHVPDGQAQDEIKAFVVAKIAESEARIAARATSRSTGTMR